MVNVDDITIPFYENVQGAMIHLREVQIKLPGRFQDEYPFNVSAIKSLNPLPFESAVTIFVGENGSGKSTLLEALATAAGMVIVGSTAGDRDPSLDAIRPLAQQLKLVWNKKTRRGFFLRAEDFFGYVKSLRALHNDMLDELDRIEREYEGRSDYVKALASQPATGSLAGMKQRYGDDLDANSHGESFLTLFQSRFVPGGLYILDEPEAALSPLRQLSLIALIKGMVAQEAQFIIATHSPILMACPGAILYDFDRQPPVRVAYDDLEHVKLYRDFLEDPEAFLRHL